LYLELYPLELVERYLRLSMKWLQCEGIHALRITISPLGPTLLSDHSDSSDAAD
jgi:hypothetical protein